MHQILQDKQKGIIKRTSGISGSWQHTRSIQQKVSLFPKCCDKLEDKSITEAVWIKIPPGCGLAMKA